MKTDFAELNRSIEGMSNPEDKEITRAMAVLVMATSVGPNAERLAEATDYPKPFIDRIVINMQKAGLFINGMVDDREWLDDEGGLIGKELFAHAHVALGLWTRHTTASGSVYVDAATGEAVD